MKKKVLNIPGNAMVTFHLGPKNLEHTELTLTGLDWKRMVENARKEMAYHLVEKGQSSGDGISRLRESYPKTDEGRIDALRERNRMEDMAGGPWGKTRFAVIAHEHFEMSTPKIVTDRISELGKRKGMGI